MSGHSISAIRRVKRGVGVARWVAQCSCGRRFVTFDQVGTRNNAQWHLEHVESREAAR